MQVFSKTEANFSWHVFAVQGCTKKKKKRKMKKVICGGLVLTEWAFIQNQLIHFPPIVQSFQMGII